MDFIYSQFLTIKMSTFQTLVFYYFDRWNNSNKAKKLSMLIMVSSQEVI